MRVDMTPILSGKTDRLSFSFDWNGAAELFPDTAFSGPVRVTGSVVNRSGYMLLMLQAEAEYETRCARCLEKLHRKITLDREKNAALKNDIREDDDDTVPVADSAIELDGPAGELLFLGLPTRDLCREDCRGLCPKCGKNLNEGDCGCDRKEIDPRLAVLKKFLDTDQ